MAAPPKLPPPRLHRIREVDGEYHALPAGSTLWRIHTTAGPHAMAWNELRRFGPIRRFRFDPQPPGPPTVHPSEGVIYLAPDIATCMAETFQDTRSIRPSAARSLSGFETATELHLLDLTGDWPLKVGAAHAINATAAKQTTKAWAVAFRTCFPSADGLWYLSSLTGWPPHSSARPRLMACFPLGQPSPSSSTTLRCGPGSSRLRPISGTECIDPGSTHEADVGAKPVSCARLERADLDLAHNGDLKRVAGALPSHARTRPVAASEGCKRQGSGRGRACFVTFPRPRTCA